MKVFKRKCNYNDTDKLRLWLFGKAIKINVPENKDNIITIAPEIQMFWFFAPTGDFYALSITITSAPNIIHRIMQRVCFGMKYRMAK